MSWIITIILTVLLAWSLYSNYKKSSEIETLKYELQRTMNLVNKATSEGFKL